MRRRLPDPPGRGYEGRRTWPLTAAVFALCLAVLAPLLASLPEHFDADAYFHLAVARAYGQQGLLADLPWARFSVMAEGFGDKELLFHAVLVPFALLGDGGLGGQLALALLVAAIAAAVGHLAMGAVGRWGALAPVLLLLTAGDLDWRLLRLRPELLSLLLLLLVIVAAADGRHRAVGLLAGVYTLSYTAFQALLGLCGLLFLYRGWARRRWEPALVLYPLLGVAVGLLVHPQFPDNLEVWILQTFDYFRLKELLDVGIEIRAEATDEVFLYNLGWWLLLVVIWRSSEAAPETAAPPPPAAAGRRDAFVLAAAAFGLLYALMLRFALYFLPFATLALLYALAARGRRLTAWTRLPGRGRVPAAAALLVCLAASSPELDRIASSLRDPRRASREAMLADLGRSVPAGAKVAARWQDTQAYVFFAPQGRYLNVLDPVFMAVPHPRAYRLQRRLFEGVEPDVPFAAVTGLDSDYLALSEGRPGNPLLARLAADPRVILVHGGPDTLVRFLPGANSSFVLDWAVSGDEGGRQGAGSGGAGQVRRYPRAADPRGRAVEGFVDLRRLGEPLGCRTFLHLLRQETAAALELELAPYGAASLAVDGELRLVLREEPRAVLGRGALLPLTLTAGEHRLRVETCPSSEVPGYGGFFLRLRPSAAAAGGAPPPGP